MKVEADKVKVRRWSFCPTCKGQGLKSCSICSGKGTIHEEVLLSEIPKLVRPEYVEAQQDFLRKQLGLEGGEIVKIT